MAVEATNSTVRRGLQNIGNRVSGPRLAGEGNNRNLRPLSPDAINSDRVNMRRYYEMLEMYAASNALYDAMVKSEWERGKFNQDVRSLMTPANAVNQFYASTVWPGQLPDALPIISDDEDELDILRECIWMIWDASNWSTNKQVTIRTGKRLGDVFLKACQRESDGHPYIQVIHPWYVSDFDTNERGNLTFIRLDMPQDSKDEKGRILIQTEVWEKRDERDEQGKIVSRGTFRFWEHYEDLDVEIEKLGEPDRESLLEDFGFDFIPFSHIKARDIGEKYGQPPILPALDKIDELNMLATELHDDLFRHNKAKFALASNMLDSEGRPVIPPELMGSDGGFEVIVEQVNGEEIYVLPGMAVLSALGSGIDWNAKISARDKMWDYLIKTDLPELKWYTLMDEGSVSGVALRRLMAPAISNVIESRGEFESGLVKVQQMCLTLGALANIDPFTQLTAWENGGLRHSFEGRDVLPLSEEEKADADMKRQQANSMMLNNGYTMRFVMTTVDNLEESVVDRMIAEHNAVNGVPIAEDLLAQRRAQEENPPEVEPPRPGEVAGT